MQPVTLWNPKSPVPRIPLPKGRNKSPSRKKTTRPTLTIATDMARASDSPSIATPKTAHVVNSDKKDAAQAIVFPNGPWQKGPFSAPTTTAASPVDRRSLHEHASQAKSEPASASAGTSNGEIKKGDVASGKDKDSDVLMEMAQSPKVCSTNAFVVLVRFR